MQSFANETFSQTVIEFLSAAMITSETHTAHILLQKKPNMQLYLVDLLHDVDLVHFHASKPTFIK